MSTWVGYIQDDRGCDVQVPWNQALVLVHNEDVPYLGTSREESVLTPLNMPMHTFDTHCDHTPWNFVDTCLYEKPMIFGLHRSEKHMGNIPF